MTKATWVVPSLDRQFRRACLESMDVEVRAECLLVDNTRVNRGVAASWNLGIDQARRLGAEWLVICSESMRFGNEGGTDFEDQLAGDICWGVCDQTCTYDQITGRGACRRGYGWHLIGLPLSTIEQVGLFDEQYYPAWWEDVDYERRRLLAGLDTGHVVVGVDAHLAALEHSLASGLVSGQWPWQVQRRFEAKWGPWNGNPHDCWTHPYNNPALDWTYTGEVPG